MKTNFVKVTMAFPQNSSCATAYIDLNRVVAMRVKKMNQLHLQAGEEYTVLDFDTGVAFNPTLEKVECDGLAVLESPEYFLTKDAVANG